jgi:Uma2 family endonuclease
MKGVNMNPQFLTAEELGIRLEIAGNLAIWEASPIYKHQKAVDRIRDSFKKSEKDGDICECIDVADVYVQFPDGSLKRPDISVFCREPEEEEEAIRQVPEAVIEVISKKYEAKDLEISPPIYLANGVKDIVVFNPYTNEVLHFREGETRNLTSPVEIQFECGCSCTV